MYWFELGQKKDCSETCNGLLRLVTDLEFIDHQSDDHNGRQ